MTASGGGAGRPGRSRPAPKPLLTLPWEGGVTGWLVVFGALVFTLVGGIVVNAASAAVATAVLAFPVAVAAGFAIVQWRQVRSSGAELSSWWHFTGAGIAVIIWLSWPTTPGVIYGVTTARQACLILVGKTPAPECLTRATHAMDTSNVAWWLTAVLILAAALLARRSKIAAWAAIPAALAGCLVATHFLELLLLHYRPGG